MTDAASTAPSDLSRPEVQPGLEPIGVPTARTAERELVVHPGAVALVPMVDDERVCLVENERYAVGKTLLEVPAGTIDPGESPEQTAERRAGGRDRLSGRTHHAHPGVVCHHRDS